MELKTAKRRTRKPSRKSTSQQPVITGTLGRLTVPPIHIPHDMRRPEMRTLLQYMGRWVYLCVTLNSRTAASVRPRLFVIGGQEQVLKCGKFKPKPVDRQTKNFLKGNAKLKPSAVAMKRLAGNIDDLTEVFDHPALEVLDNVNDWEEGFGYRESIYADLDMFGRHFTNLIATGPEAPPDGLWRMLPHITTVVPHPTEFVSHFEYGRGTERKRFERDDVFWIKLHDPEDPWGGMGPLEAWLKTVDSDFTMVNFQQWLFSRGGTPDVIIIVKGGTTEDQRKSMRSDWRRLYGDMARREESLAVIGGDATVTQLSQKPKEMEFVESRAMVRDEICAAFGVPKSMVTTDDVNRANAEATNAGHITNKIWPLICRVEDAINQRLLPRWSDRLVIIHENPLREDQAIVIQNRESKLKSGWSVNELRLEEGEEPADDPMADEPMIATGVVPLKNITEAGKPPPVPEGIGGSGKPQGADDKAMNASAPDSLPADAVAVKADDIKRLIELLEPFSIEALAKKQKQACTHASSQSAELAKAWDGDRGDWGNDPPESPEISSARFKFLKQWAESCKAAPQGELDEGSVPGFTKRMEEAIRAQVAALLASIEKAGNVVDGRPDVGLVNQAQAEMLSQEMIERVRAAVRPFIQRSLQIGGDFGAAGLTQQAPNLTLGFDVFNPEVQRFIDDYTVRLTDQINGTTLARAKDILDDGLKQGEFVQQLVQRVKDWAAEAGDATRGVGARAENIARTESARAYVEGQQAAWKQSGVVTGKRWLLAGGACPICEAVAAEFNSKQVSLGTPFYRVGDVIKHRDGEYRVDYADVTGPPLHPQCRCDLIAVLEGEV